MAPSLIGCVGQLDSSAAHENRAEVVGGCLSAYPCALWLNGSLYASLRARRKTWRPVHHWVRVMRQAACLLPSRCLSLCPAKGGTSHGGGGEGGGRGPPPIFPRAHSEFMVALGPALMTSAESQSCCYHWWRDGKGSCNVSALDPTNSLASSGIKFLLCHKIASNASERLSLLELPVASHRWDEGGPPKIVLD